MTAVVKKALAGLQDLALGEGSEAQTRGGEQVTVTKINAEWIFANITEIKALDTSRFKHVRLIDTNQVVKTFDYIGASTATGNDQDVLQPTLGSGRWILRKTNNTLTQTTATGTGGISTSSHTDIPVGFVIVALYNDDTHTPGTGQSYVYTGVTTAAKATNWPNADGYYYDADGKQFSIYDPANLPTGVNSIAATTYTFVATDQTTAGGKAIIPFTNAAAITATIPPNSLVKFKLGLPINIVQIGTGKITLVPGAGVEIKGPASTTGQYHALSIVQYELDKWVVIGGQTQVTTAGAAVQISAQTLSCDNGLCGIVLDQSGNMTLIDDSGNTELPNEWCLPKTPNIGSLFQVRLSTPDGTGYPNVGSPYNIWITLDQLVGWGVQQNGATKACESFLEIRVKATEVVVDSAAINLTSVYVP